MCHMEDDPSVIDEPVTLDNMFTLASFIGDNREQLPPALPIIPRQISPIEPDECVNPLCFCRNSRRRTTIDVE